jgi:hypothetical protein
VYTCFVQGNTVVMFLWTALSAKARKTPVRAWVTNKWLFLLLAMHWILLVGVITIGDPASHVSKGVHQPVRQHDAPLPMACDHVRSQRFALNGFLFAQAKLASVE